MIVFFSQQDEFCYDGRFCFIRLDSLPEGFHPHSHDYEEIVIALQGTADHVINGCTFAVKPGSVFVVRGHTVHSFTNCSDDFAIYNVGYRRDSLPEDSLRQMPGYHALFVLEPAYRNTKENQASMVLAGGELSQVLGHARKMLQGTKQRQAGYECMVLAGVIELSVMLCRMYQSHDRKKNLIHLGSAIAYMETNFCQMLSVDELAEMAHMSRRHFFRTFKEIFNRTPVDYLISLKLREAARLLLSCPDRSIGQISQEVGFDDSNYFSRQFRRQFGCSPRQHRNSNLSL